MLSWARVDGTELLPCGLWGLRRISRRDCDYLLDLI
jgi:hypothetical protein